MYPTGAYGAGMTTTIPSAITLRPTGLADVTYLPAIERSAARAFLQHPGLAYIAEGEAGISEEQHKNYVAIGTSWVAIQAEISSAPCGFLCAQAQGCALHIYEVSVAEHAQGRGIGKALVQHCCAEAKRRGYTNVTLTTFTTVPWNRPFYEKLGFSVLANTELPVFLRDILQTEEAHGFTVPRCAMRKIIEQR